MSNTEQVLSKNDDDSNLNQIKSDKIEQNDTEEKNESNNDDKEGSNTKIAGEEGAPNPFVKWDESLKKWIYTDEKTNVKYEWDEQLRAYLPLIIDETVKSQQSIYDKGFDNEDKDKKPITTSAKKRKIREERKKIIAEQREKKAKKISTSILVKGLPKDITEKEFLDFCSKAGVVRKFAQTKKPMIVLYKDENGDLTGEGRVTYFRAESINLAFVILDGDEIKPGYPVTIEESEYQEGDEEDLEKLKKSKNRRVYDQSQELSWEEKEEKHVIIKHCFDPVEALEDVYFYEDLKNNFKEECEKQCGEVVSVKVFERNPEGVIAVKFARGYDAEKCIELMNGRWFDGRRLTAEFYDGISDYFVAEKDEDKAARDKKWAEWLGDEPAE